MVSGRAGTTPVSKLPPAPPLLVAPAGAGREAAEVRADRGGGLLVLVLLVAVAVQEP